MKQFTQFTLAMSIVIAMTGCEKEMFNAATPAIIKSDDYTISAQLPNDEIMTKMSFSEEYDSAGYAHLSSCWKDGDAFSISPDTYSTENVTIFSLIGGNGSKTGIFSCNKPYEGTSSKWTVFYPASITCDADYSAFSFEGQSQKGNDNTDHLSAYNLMRKAYSYDFSTGMPSEIAFSGDGFEQSSCLKLIINNLPKAIVVKKLKVEAFHYVNWYWSALSQQLITEADFSQSMSFSDMPLSTQLVAYMMIPPSNVIIRKNGYLRITITDENGIVFTTERKMANEINLVAGTYNTISLKKNWIEDKDVDGTWGYFQKPSAADVNTLYCNFIIMGDGYTPEDYEGDESKFVQDARAAYNALFSVEPYKSLKDYFGVYYVNVVSQQRFNTTGTYQNGAKNVDQNTSLQLKFSPNRTKIQGDETRILYYAERIDELTASQVCRSTIIVIANHNCHSGTCTVYYGFYETDYCEYYSIAYAALGNDNEHQANSFKNTVIHEAGGHGFGKLADEYTTSSYYLNLERTQNELLSLHSKGIYKNIHPYSSGVTYLSDTPWANLADINIYTPEQIGLYDGAYAVRNGFCRSTPSSIMENGSYFNAISRKQIYHRVMRMSGKTATEAENGFLAWDAEHLPQEGPYVNAALAAKGLMRISGADTLLPLAPPELRCLP